MSCEETKRRVKFSDLKSLISRNNSPGCGKETKKSELERQIETFCEWAVERFDDESIRDDVHKILAPLLSTDLYHGSLLQVNCRLKKVEVGKIFLLPKKKRNL